MKGYPGMKKLGRKPSVEPKTAYDVRRYITLVQVLAMKDAFNRKQALILLATEWGVKLPCDPFSMASTDIAHRIAEHVIEYHRSDEVSK